MALTINQFIGFETGGLEEASAVTGSPDATEATVVKSGFRALKLAHSANRTYDFTPFSEVADAGNDYVIGFAFRTNDTSPNFRANFLHLLEADGDEFLRLGLQTDGDLELLDDGLSIIGTAATPFSNDTWHYVEIYFQHSTSGSVEVFVDGTSVIGPLSAKDLSSGDTFDEIRLEVASTNTSSDFYFDDIYLLSGATSASDRLGESEVFKYQSTKASAVPDDGGGNLNTGNWSDAGEMPGSEANVAIYTSAGAGAIDSDDTNGFPEGPKNDARIDGDSNIKALKGIWHMKRGTGGGAAHFGLLGNDVDGAARTADFDPTTAYVDKFHLTEASGGAAGDIPLSTEYCRIGFETDGAQDFDCGDMWAMLLHVPAAAVGLAGHGLLLSGARNQLVMGH